MRHAQKYWLEIQAKEAVEKAMQKEVILDAGDLVIVGTSDYNFISNVRELLLEEAAKHLVRAEMLHRAMTRTGKKND